MGILAVFGGVSDNASLCKMKQNEMRLKPVYIGILLATLFLFGNPIGALAQEAAKDSLLLEKVNKLEQVAAEYETAKWILGIVAVIFLALGVRNVWGFKKRVQKVMDEKAEEVIEKGIAEKFGTTSEVLRFAFKKFDLLSKLRSKKLLIVNSHEDKQYREIYRVLNGEGFEYYDFTSVEELNSGKIKGHHLLIINDVVESKFTADSIGMLLEKHGNEIKVLYFGQKHLPTYDIKGLSLYFANSYASLISRIEEILIEY